ncbi:MAG TPA: beta-propeller fold lactonase family protein [Polyangiaceae bacterium]|nr:beta-propeller fold lactonase family protein [Polyangiaceae bacterium]
MLVSRRTLLASTIVSGGAWIGAGALLFTGSGCRKKPAPPGPERLYVSTEEGGEVVVLEATTLAIVARIPVGKRPRGLKLASTGSELYVALSGSPRSGPGADESKLPPADRRADGIGVVDLTVRKLIRTLESGQDPETFDLSKDGQRAFISNEETAELSVLDLKSGHVVSRVAVGDEPEGVSLRPDGAVVYVTSEADGGVSVVDTKTLKVVAQFTTGPRPRVIAFTKNGKQAFISNELGGSVSVVDAVAHRVTGEIPVTGPGPAPHRPMGLVLSSDEGQLFVSTGRGGAVAVIDVLARKVSRWISGVGARPWGLTVSRDGKRLYTANGPSNDVSMLEVATGQVLKRAEIGGLPWGIIAG